MKLFVKLLILMVIVAVAGPFFIKGPDGRPLWEWQDSWAKFNRWRTQVAVDSVSVIVPDAGLVTVYRWQDADGQWHFSNDAPAGQQVDALLIDPKTNAVQAQSVPEPADVEVVADSDEAPQAHISPLLPLPDPATTRQLLDDVRQLQETADERRRQLDGI